MRFVFEESPPPACGARRGKWSNTRCELLPGHDHQHAGRSPSGRWFSWQVSETHDALVGIRERLSDPKAWTKGHWARDAHGLEVGYAEPTACSWCLQGAALVELALGHSYSLATGRLYSDVCDAIAKAAQIAIAKAAQIRRGRSRPVSGDAVAHFNDRESTEHHHVLEVLDKAIEATA